MKIRENKIIRSGDKVIVIAGDDRGLIGPVLSRTDDRVTVQGVNVCKKHVKKSQENPSGGTIQIERSIHVSNVALCIDEEKPLRVRVKTEKDGKRVLAYKEGKTEKTYRPIKKANNK